MKNALKTLAVILILTICLSCSDSDKLPLLKPTPVPETSTPEPEQIKSTHEDFGEENGFVYKDNGDGTCTITTYKGEQAGDLVIPREINGLAVTIIGDSYFAGIMGRSAFTDCTGFTGNLIIPDSVTRIELCAFSGCSGLTGTLVIPNSVTHIGMSAFDGCSGFTGTVVIPNNVTTIEPGVFTRCSGIASIDISAQNPYYATLDGILFNKDKSELIQAPGGMQVENYVVPSSVQTISSYAFQDCDGLTGSITIPETVTRIGAYAFSDCNDLVSIEVSELNQNYSSLDGMLLAGKSELFCVPAGMQRENYVIPSSIVRIFNFAFSNCSGFTGNLTIPDSVTYLGDGAFYGCSGLTSITIGSHVTDMGYNSVGCFIFANCSNLTQVDFLTNAPEGDVFENMFDDCADDFKIIYDPLKSGWSTPLWRGYPCYPKA